MNDHELVSFDAQGDIFGRALYVSQQTLALISQAEGFFLVQRQDNPIMNREKFVLIHPRRKYRSKQAKSG